MIQQMLHSHPELFLNRVVDSLSFDETVAPRDALQSRHALGELSVEQSIPSEWSLGKRDPNDRMREEERRAREKCCRRT